MWRLLLLHLSLAVPASLYAQTVEELLSRASDAFENLDFEDAAQLYTRVLDAASGATLAQRDSAQLYLGVSYEFAGQRANAVSVFRVLVRNSPCAPAPEVFGASVTAAFVEARGEVFAVGLCEVRAQQLAPGDAATFRIAVTRPALVQAFLQDSTGQIVTDFGEQATDGISTVQWTDIPDPALFGEHAKPYTLVVHARERQGAQTDQKSLPISVYAPPADTLAHPPPLADSVFLAESRTTAPAVRDLAKGLLVGAGIAASSALAYRSLEGESGKALAVAGAVSFAGIVAFIKGRSGREITGNKAHNTALKNQWAARRDSVVAENRSRIAARQLIIKPLGERQ